MSIEEAFGDVCPPSALSVASQRRRRLLQTVLPSFLVVAARNISTARRYSPARAFWSRFLAPCVLMENGGWKLDRLVDRHGELLEHLLQALERVVNMGEADICEEFNSSPFPRLETIRRNLQLEGEEEGVNETVDLIKPTNSLTCDSLLELLNDLADAIGDNDQQPLPESTVVISKSKPVLVPLLVDMLSTISKHLKCSCTMPHKAMLLLYTHKTLAEKGEHSFNMLLTEGKHVESWRDTVVLIKEKKPELKVRMVLPEFERQPHHTQPAQKSFTPVLDLCRSIKAATVSPLNLSIERGQLYQQVGTEQDADEISQGQSVSLAKALLDTDSQELDLKHRICLAVVLSYALLDFCGEPWFPTGWTKDGICLLQRASYLSLRPALIACVRPGPENPHISRMSDDVKLLFHGIILMEIFKQEPLPIDQLPTKTKDIVTLRSEANGHFDRIRWGVCERYRQSVQACLEGFQRLTFSNDEDDQAFSQTFCQRVIGPLEADYASVWGSRDPDEVISEVKRPKVIVKPSISMKTPPPLAPKPIQFRIGRTKPGVSQLRIERSITSLHFFDTGDTSDPAQIAGSKEWFRWFDRLEIQQQLPKRAMGKNNRIKIAVLDTGINMSNPWIQQKIGRIQCWPTQQDCEDSNGHGTHVAYLLLRIAPHAQLKIAKVSKSHLLRDASIEHIAKAIRHFSSDDYNRVDIINISFGFPLFKDELLPIREAIAEARKNNVLVFAAAGNEGGNQPIYWPAKLHSAGDVICISSCDGTGNASNFNPTSSSSNRICTLGEGVPSCEIDAPQQAIIHRSGTSFATPIAVAIAAIVLGFVENVRFTDVPEDFAALKRRLYTKSGMERILRTCCVLQDQRKRSGYSYITPWFFLEIQESARVHIIANELRSIAE